MGATFWCGTNAVLRRKALEDIGGVPEDNIAEDFLASLFLHKKGWRSEYVAEILAEGYAPHNLGEYASQQFRWARGSSELIFKHNVLFNKALTLRQKVQYLYSSSYYLNGFIVLIDALIPIFVLLTGILPVKAGTANFMLFFFPFILSTMHLLMISTDHALTFKAVQLSISSSFVFNKAVLYTIFGVKSGFRVTSKEAKEGNYIRLAIPHILYVFAGILAFIFAYLREGLSVSVVTNASWLLFNIVMLSGFIRVAYPWGGILGHIRNWQAMRGHKVDKSYVYVKKFDGNEDNV